MERNPSKGKIEKKLIQKWWIYYVGKSKLKPFGLNEPLSEL